MKTRPAQPRDTARYITLRDSSPNYQKVMDLASKFYSNQASWSGLEAEAQAHRQACKDWGVELASAGFTLGYTGLRVIVQPRNV